MKPQNVKERRNSFLKFSLLFLGTVVAIVSAIFFTFKVPSKENDLLKNNEKRIKKEIAFQTKFASEMALVKGMLDSIDRPGANISFEDNKIGKKLTDMQSMIPTRDSTYKYDMYTRVVTSFVELQEIKGKLRGLKDAENTIEEYKEAFGKCEEENKTLNRMLLIK